MNAFPVLCLENNEESTKCVIKSQSAALLRPAVDMLVDTEKSDASRYVEEAQGSNAEIYCSIKGADYQYTLYGMILFLSTLTFYCFQMVSFFDLQMQLNDVRDDMSRGCIHNITGVESCMEYVEPQNYTCNIKYDDQIDFVECSDQFVVYLSGILFSFGSVLLRIVVIHALCTYGKDADRFRKQFVPYILYMLYQEADMAFEIGMFFISVDGLSKSQCMKRFSNSPPADEGCEDFVQEAIDFSKLNFATYDFSLAKSLLILILFTIPGFLETQYKLKGEDKKIYIWQVYWVKFITFWRYICTGKIRQEKDIVVVYQGDQNLDIDQFDRFCGSFKHKMHEVHAQLQWLLRRGS